MIQNIVRVLLKWNIFTQLQFRGKKIVPFHPLQFFLLFIIEVLWLLTQLKYVSQYFLQLCLLPKQGLSPYFPYCIN